MAWPVTRSDGFVVDEDVWNELVSALSVWGGNVNGNGANLTNLNAVYAAAFLPTSGNNLFINVDGTFSDGIVSLPNQVFISGNNVPGAGNERRIWFTTSGSLRAAIAIQGVESSGNAGSNFHIFNCDDAGTVLRPASGDVFIKRSSGFIGLGWATPGLPLSFPPAVGEKIALYDDTAGGDVFGLGMSAGALQIFSGLGGAVKIARRSAPSTYVDEFILDPGGRGLLFPVGDGSAQPIADGSFNLNSCSIWWSHGTSQLMFRVRDSAGIMRQVALAVP